MKLKRMQAACTVLLQITAVSKDIYNSFDPIKPTFNFFPSVPASCTPFYVQYALHVERRYGGLCVVQFRIPLWLCVMQLQPNKQIC